jgi:hypothetical protein
VQTWKEDYPWFRRALDQIGPGAKGASEAWRKRIEDELETTLDFKARPDGTATVWCGMSGYDFDHYPTPKELFEGLVAAYRREVKRAGGSYPTRTSQWKMSPVVSAPSAATLVPLAPIAVATREGPVEISPPACEALLEEVGRSGSGEPVVQALRAGSAATPISFDRPGKIVVFDAIWTLVERAGAEYLIDPQLRLLRDRFRDEIAQGPTAT